MTNAAKSEWYKRGLPSPFFLIPLSFRSAFNLIHIFLLFICIFLLTSSETLASVAAAVSEGLAGRRYDWLYPDTLSFLKNCATCAVGNVFHLWKWRLEEGSHGNQFVVSSQINRCLLWAPSAEKRLDWLLLMRIRQLTESFFVLIFFFPSILCLCCFSSSASCFLHSVILHAADNLFRICHWHLISAMGELAKILFSTAAPFLWIQLIRWWMYNTETVPSIKCSRFSRKWVIRQRRNPFFTKSQICSEGMVLDIHGKRRKPRTKVQSSLRFSLFLFFTLLDPNENRTNLQIKSQYQIIPFLFLPRHIRFNLEAYLLDFHHPLSPAESLCSLLCFCFCVFRLLCCLIIRSFFRWVSP